MLFFLVSFAELRHKVCFSKLDLYFTGIQIFSDKQKVCFPARKGRVWDENIALYGKETSTYCIRRSTLCNLFFLFMFPDNRTLLTLLYRLGYGVVQHKYARAEEIDGLIDIYLFESRKEFLRHNLEHFSFEFFG